MLIGIVLAKALRFILSMLGRNTQGTDRKLRTRIRDKLSLKPVFDEDLEPCEEPVQDSLIPATA